MPRSLAQYLWSPDRSRCSASCRHARLEAHPINKLFLGNRNYKLTKDERPRTNRVLGLFSAANRSSFIVRRSSFFQGGQQELSEQTYLNYLQNRYGIEADGRLTDFLSRRDGRLLLADQVDLNAMIARYGAPLEIAYCPLITEQIERMQGWAAGARARTGYDGAFLYAYATKANFAEEVVRTALASGAHYETSATADVLIAHHLWRQGVLPEDRFIFANGSKEDAYIDAIVALREAGYVRIVPILDDLCELEALIERCDAPLLLGVRERHAVETAAPAHAGGERFGLTPDEIAQAAERLQGTPHRLVVYHAMVGSQIEDVDGWMARLARSAENYCRLRRRVPSLQAFNFGGGMPTSAYALDFSFDYAGFLERLMRELAATCAAYDVPQPDIIGEFGRYTVASHNLFLLEVGAVKPGQADAPPWYLVNGSMMVSLPDSLIVEDQQFVVLPLDRWDAPVAEARLAGRRTCDSDDVFPRPSQPPLALPADAEGMVLAIFGVGAYQQMISGRGGAHHCLNPEMRRIIIERDGDALVVREIAPQSLGTIMALLGYTRETLEPVAVPTPARAPVERRAAREVARQPRAPRRRQSAFRGRAPLLREPRGARAA
jgi:arginine decarboxylase